MCVHVSMSTRECQNLQPALSPNQNTCDNNNYLMPYSTSKMLQAATSAVEAVYHYVCQDVVK